MSDYRDIFRNRLRHFVSRWVIFRQFRGSSNATGTPNLSATICGPNKLQLSSAETIEFLACMSFRCLKELAAFPRLYSHNVLISWSSSTGPASSFRLYFRLWSFSVLSDTTTKTGNPVLWQTDKIMRHKVHTGSISFLKFLGPGLYLKMLLQFGTVCKDINIV